MTTWKNFLEPLLFLTTTNAKVFEASLLGIPMVACLEARDSRSIAFHRCKPKPLQPLLDFPSGTTIKPLRLWPWMSSDINKKEPWRIKNLSPSQKDFANWPWNCPEISSSTLNSNLLALPFPMKIDLKESLPLINTKLIKHATFLNCKLLKVFDSTKKNTDKCKVLAQKS